MIDLRITGAHVIDFNQMQFVQRDVAIDNGQFIESTDAARQTIDGTGKYIVPAFIDTHVHYESSLVEIEQFATVLAQNGVVTSIIDCHEIANIFGVSGIQKVLNEVKQLASELYVQLPSCVPASSNDQSPSVVTSRDIELLLQDPSVLGLGEVMDVFGVLDGNPELLKKIQVVRDAGGIIDGHVPNLPYPLLKQYASYGIQTNHECETLEMAKNCLELGMYVQIREGSVAKNLDALLPLLHENHNFVTFCTDDKTITDLVNDGSINSHIQRAIKQGVNPIIAYKAATLNAANCYRLNQGSIEVGKDAHFIILNDVESVAINAVYKHGARIDQLNQTVSDETLQNRHFLKQSMVHLQQSPCQLPLSGNQVRTIEVVPNQLISKEAFFKIDKTENFEGDRNQQLMKLVLIPRMLKSEKKGIGIVSQCYFDGALVSTVSHDAHHLIGLSSCDQDLELVIKRAQEIGGGVVYAKDGVVLSELALEIAGLTTETPYPIAARQYQEIKDMLVQSGFKGQFDPIIALSFLALPVIPKIKLTLDGYFDIEQNIHVPLEIGE